MSLDFLLELLGQVVVLLVLEAIKLVTSIKVSNIDTDCFVVFLS